MIRPPRTSKEEQKVFQGTETTQTSAELFFARNQKSTLNKNDDAVFVLINFIFFRCFFLQNNREKI